MKTCNRTRSNAPRSRVVSCAFGSLVLFGLACSAPAVAQTLTPRPVARLISASGTDARIRRVGVTDPKLNLSTPGAASPSFAEATAAERRAFEVTNELRSRSGLAPLEWDPELCIIARRHSRNMSDLDFFSHQTPEGLRLRDRARLAGIRYRVIAENIAYNQGFEDPGAFAVERWTASPGHRANLLSTEFQSSAVGTFVASDGRVFLTQLFILR